MNNATGQPDYSKSLNATLVQVFKDGTITKTPCYFDKNQTPMQATDLTPIDQHLLAGPETDRYIILNNDPAKTEYRTYETIGPVQEIEID